MRDRVERLRAIIACLFEDEDEDEPEAALRRVDELGRHLRKGGWNEAQAAAEPGRHRDGKVEASMGGLEAGEDATARKYLRRAEPLG